VGRSYSCWVDVALPTTCEPPKPVDLLEEMTPAAWATYYRSVWDARLDMTLATEYFGRASRYMGGAETFLQWIVTLGSAGAVASLVAHATLPAGIVAGLAASCSAAIQVMQLKSRAANVAMIAEAAAARAAYWNEAFVMVRDGKYLGPFSKLHEPDRAIASAALAQRVPDVAWVQRRIMNAITKTDSIVLETRSTT